jgi:DNA processing protein
VTRDPDRLRIATLAMAARPPGRLLSALRAEGPAGLEAVAREATPTAVERADGTIPRLVAAEVGVLLYGQSGYPPALTELAAPPPVLFYWGNLALLDQPSVGMCGSRAASEVGLNAARACGNAVARAGLTIVSGYAKGVDTETHLAALEAGGRTIIVLAEGFAHFQVKRAFRKELDPERMLVLSQFPPRQTWHVGAAMTRNAVIAGLGRALVVIEANGTGGTLDAGLQALAMGRPVLALEFESGPTPEGNRVLIDQGAIAIRTPRELAAQITAIRDPVGASENLPLALG